MGVKVNIPVIYRGITSGESPIEVSNEATTVGAVISELISRYPGLESRILNADGEIQKFTNLCVGTEGDGGESVRALGGLATPVNVETTYISILPGLSGGSE
jgi:molybdopterin converting factor small subunit